MTVTKSKKGRWIVLVSDASSASAVAQDLADALNDEDVPLSQFVLFDVTNKIAVFKR